MIPTDLARLGHLNSLWVDYLLALTSLIRLIVLHGLLLLGLISHWLDDKLTSPFSRLAGETHLVLIDWDDFLHR